MIVPRVVQETASEHDREDEERGVKWTQVGEHQWHRADFDRSFNYGSQLIRLNSPIQIVLASGSNLFLEGILRILEANDDIKIVAQTSKAEEVEKYLAEIKPKFLFLDNRSLALNIQKLSNLIAKESPSTQVILFGDYIEGESGLQNTVHVTRKTDSSELIRIIKGLSRGALPERANGGDDVKHKFTKMEMKIIDSFAESRSNKQIAKRLSISDKTVKSHLSNIFMKLGIQNRYQLIIYARKLKDRVV